MLQQYMDAIEKSNIVSRTDTEGIITFVNDEFCNISGYTKEELVGKNHNIIRHPDVPASNFELLWNTIKAKKTYKATVKNRAKDGTSFYVNTTVTPILNEEGEIEEYIAIRYDVTQEILLREELEQKQKVMFWQSRLASLGQMLANIAHQWRQPLTELSLTTFNMKKASLKDEKDDVIKFYNESKDIIKNMSNTIDDFTNFFKPDKEKKYFHLEDSINESIVILKKIIRKEKIFIKTSFSDIEVLGVTNELTQVIINLIQNSNDAFKYNDISHKSIKITTKEDNQIAIIELEDNAGGIKEENLDKIFEPYFTTKHSSSGTGLGLFMSKMICEQGFSGTIDVLNNKNGVTFIIKIPLEGYNGK